LEKILSTTVAEEYEGLQRRRWKSGFMKKAVRAEYDNAVLVT
jgi:hypothetical protein